MDTEEKTGNILMGPNGPLYWIGIYILVIAIGGFCVLANKIMDRRDCLSLGDNYIYIDAIPPCYRIVEGQMYYVNVSKEHALRDYQKSRR